MKEMVEKDPILHERWVAMVDRCTLIGFKKSKHLIDKRILVMLPDGKYVMEDDNPQVRKTWGNCAQVAKSLGMKHYDSTQFSLCLVPTKTKTRVHYYGIQLRYTLDNVNPTESFKNVACLVYRKCGKCHKFPGHKYPDQCS